MTRPHAPRKKAGSGFSLVEILIVVCIIAVLAALLVPMTSSLVTKARQTGCLQNQRSLYQGLRLLATDRDDTFLWTSVPADSGNNWHRNIWPYLHENGTYANWASPDLLAATKKLYLCPANPNRTPVVSYALNTQLRNRKFSTLSSRTVLLLDFDGSHTTDGTASALNLRLKGWHDPFNAATFADGHAELLTRSNIPDRVTKPEFWGITTN